MAILKTTLHSNVTGRCRVPQVLFVVQLFVFAHFVVLGYELVFTRVSPARIPCGLYGGTAPPERPALAAGTRGCFIRAFPDSGVLRPWGS